jgi:hypothetical protein
MERSSNLKLFQLLLNFNFFFLESKKNLKSYSIIKKKIRLKRVNKLSSVVLNPVVLMKSIKQLIRVFQYLKKKDNSLLHIEFKNPYSLIWMRYLLNKNKNYSKNIFLRKNPYIQKSDKLQALLSLGTRRKKNVFKNLLFENVLITYLVNSSSNKNDFGVYKLYNELNNWKKMIFFFLLIKTILLKKKYEKKSKI